LTAQTLIGSGELEKGLATYRAGLRAHPSRRALVYGYVSALLDATRAAEAVDFLSGRLETRSPDARLYELQSRGYTALGKRLLQHRAQAEAYVLRKPSRRDRTTATRAARRRRRLLSEIQRRGATQGTGGDRH
jgi:predicted Zn-dependent protease